MNCDEFKENLYEYLEPGSPGRSGAEEHLQECAACRRLVQEEQAAAAFLGESFERATAGIVFRRKSAVQMRVRPVRRGVWEWLGEIPGRPAFAAVAVVLAVLAWCGIHQYRHLAPRPVTRPAEVTVCVIDVPFQNSAHRFERRNGMVLDVIAPSQAFGYARFVTP